MKRIQVPQGFRRGKAAWNCVDCYAGRLETLLHAVHSRLIIDFHREPIKARPLGVANARAVAVPDIDSQVVVIAPEDKKVAPVRRRVTSSPSASP